MNNEQAEELAALEREITVSGRKFILKEHTLEGTGLFVAALHTAVANQESAWLQGADGQRLYDQVAMDSDLVLEMILQHPVDGQPVEAEFIASLTSSQRELLIDAQTELDGLNNVDYAARIVGVMRSLQASAEIPDGQTAQDVTPSKHWSLRTVVGWATKSLVRRN